MHTKNTLEPNHEIQAEVICRMDEIIFELINSIEDAVDLLEDLPQASIVTKRLKDKLKEIDY